MTWHGTNSPYAYIVLGASPQIDIGYHNISLAWFSILVNGTKNVGGYTIYQWLNLLLRLFSSTCLLP